MRRGSSTFFVVVAVGALVAAVSKCTGNPPSGATPDAKDATASIGANVDATDSNDGRGADADGDAALGSVSTAPVIGRGRFSERESKEPAVRVQISRVDPKALSSFHQGYFDIFQKHEPVYVTADAILHAWHESYDQILMDLEVETLSPELRYLLTSLRKHLAELPEETRGRAEMDSFLTIASSLATGAVEVPDAGGDASAVKATVNAVLSASGPQDLRLFGTVMQLDCSVMKPRGHYTKSPALKNYFRVMSFLGRVPLKVADRESATGKWQVNRTALASLALLHSLFTTENERNWRAIDSTIASLVGPADSMSPFDAFDAAKAVGTDLHALGSADDATVQRVLSAASKQRIGADLRKEGEEAISAHFLGQRYTFDSEVLSAVSFGGIAGRRMMPSPLDVATVVFANPAAEDLLAPEKARWGKEYSDALAKMIRARDDAGETLWAGSLNHLVLGALRELSPDSERDQKLPDPLRSKAWNRRLLNTQLSSWAELRHDNILYTKQSFTMSATCEYPQGYVDPYPRFFGALEKLAKRGSETMKALPWQHTGSTERARYFEHFQKVAGRLRGMAAREQRNEELTQEELDFLDHMVSVVGRHSGCEEETVPGGWFADLYVGEARRKIWQHDPIVADIHTQPTDEEGNEVGRVLHVGTGMPREMKVTIAHDGGAHTRTYRGFVSTYLETTTSGFKRYTDEEWRARPSSASVPPPWLTPALAAK